MQLISKCLLPQKVLKFRVTTFQKCERFQRRIDVSLIKLLLLIFLNICQWLKYLHLMLLNLLLSIHCGTWAITYNTTAHRSAKGPTRTDVLHTQAFQGDGRFKYKENRVRVSCKSALSWLLNFPRGQRLWRVINTIVRLRNYCVKTCKMCWIQPMTVSREERKRVRDLPFWSRIALRVFAQINVNSLS